MKTETERLRHQVKTAHGFIRGLHRRATGYGSSFSEGVVIDCENFLRDNPTPKDTTHIVITRAYLNRLMDCAKDRLRLIREARQRAKN